MKKVLVRGQSMRPFLQALDECEVSPKDISNITTGDIIMYVSKESDEPIVHRVLNINIRDKYFTAKGDNLPSETVERVSFDDVRGVVVSVRRARKLYDLTSPRRKLTSRLTAFLSARDLTPKLFKRSYVDPGLLACSKKKIFKVLRKYFYREIFFDARKTGEKVKVVTYVNDKKGAEAVFGRHPSGIMVNTYIRYRDRNDCFIGKIVEMIIKITDEEFGSEEKIFLTDEVLGEYVSKNRTISRVEYTGA